MLETLVSLVNATSNAVYYTFHYSVKIGHILVTAINVILAQLSAVFTNILTLLSILIESISIFLQDVTLSVQQISFGILQAFELVFGIITNVCIKIYSTIDSTVSLMTFMCVSLGHFVRFLYVATIELFAYFKRLVLLFGSGVWFLVTLIPLFMVYMGNLAIYYVGRLFQEIYQIVYSSGISSKQALTSAVNFVTDIPLTSFVGLLIGLTLMYILVKFYIITTSYLTRKFRLIVRRIKNMVRRNPIEVRWPAGNTVRGRRPINIVSRPIVIVPPPRNQTTTEQTTKEESVNGEDESRNCVVCLSRLKCVLLLPCCHVCLCVECSSELEYYEFNCPICRNHIESTKRIYF